MSQRQSDYIYMLLSMASDLYQALIILPPPPS